MSECPVSRKQFAALQPSYSCCRCKTTILYHVGPSYTTFGKFSYLMMLSAVGSHAKGGKSPISTVLPMSVSVSDIGVSKSKNPCGFPGMMAWLSNTGESLLPRFEAGSKVGNVVLCRLA